jgi:hypothetical protein
MTRKLKSVEALPQTHTDLLLPGADALSVDDDPA